MPSNGHIHVTSINDRLYPGTTRLIPPDELQDHPSRMHDTELAYHHYHAKERIDRLAADLERKKKAFLKAEKLWHQACSSSMAIETEMLSRMKHPA